MKAVPIFCGSCWEPKTPGERSRHADPYKFTPGTPRPFVPQHNFADHPSQVLKNGVQDSATKGGGAAFTTPHPVKPRGG